MMRSSSSGQSTVASGCSSVLFVVFMILLAPFYGLSSNLGPVLGFTQQTILSFKRTTYRNLCSQAVNAVPLSAEPYRVGLVLPVQMDGRVYPFGKTSSYFTGVRATRPGNIGTLLCIDDRQARQVTSAPDYDWKTAELPYLLYLVDYRTGELLYKGTYFDGGIPSERVLFVLRNAYDLVPFIMGLDTR